MGTLISPQETGIDMLLINNMSSCFRIFKTKTKLKLHSSYHSAACRAFGHSSWTTQYFRGGQELQSQSGGQLGCCFLLKSLVVWLLLPTDQCGSQNSRLLIILYGHFPCLQQMSSLQQIISQFKGGGDSCKSEEISGLQQVISVESRKTIVTKSTARLIGSSIVF